MYLGAITKNRTAIHIDVLLEFNLCREGRLLKNQGFPYQLLNLQGLHVYSGFATEGQNLLNDIFGPLTILEHVVQISLGLVIIRKIIPNQSTVQEYAL